MRNQIKNIFNSKESEISILIIVCCMIANILANSYYGNRTHIAVIASLLGGITLVFILIWATVKLIAHKEVKEMPRKSRLIIESISRLLFLYWIYITVGLILAIVWAAFILWDGITSVKRNAQ